MTERRPITSEDFEILLSWLDFDPEAAALKYEKIRTRLIRLLIGRGCHEAEELADETINRVTIKAPQIRGTYVGDPALYFSGVAEKVHLEWLRKQKKAGFVELKETGRYDEEVEPDHRYECFEKCLNALPEDLRRLIVEYYHGEKRAKIEHHRELAEKWGLSVNALQTKTCRIRAGLRKSVKKCMSGK